MNKEEIRKQNVEAVDAFLRGEKIEFRDKHREKWYVCREPEWEFDTWDYRPAPPKKYWSKPADVPKIPIWIRARGAVEFRVFVVGVRPIGIAVVNDHHSKIIEWVELGEYEYSSDCETWLDCEV